MERGAQMLSDSSMSGPFSAITKAPDGSYRLLGVDGEKGTIVTPSSSKFEEAESLFNERLARFTEYDGFAKNLGTELAPVGGDAAELAQLSRVGEAGSLADVGKGVAVLGAEAP